jgi:hypothetical protein
VDSATEFADRSAFPDGRQALGGVYHEA